MYLCTYVSMYLSIYLSIHLSIHLSIYLSIYPSIYACTIHTIFTFFIIHTISKRYNPYNLRSLYKFTITTHKHLYYLYICLSMPYHTRPCHLIRSNPILSVYKHVQNGIISIIVCVALLQDLPENPRKPQQRQVA